MTVPCFVDTNVLLSAATARPERLYKHETAYALAAERLGASILYTEDLNHGQRYGAVLVHNPFRDL
jgi:predicted nucleic acid-binding protein